VLTTGYDRRFDPRPGTLPITFGTLLDFVRDPLLCMRRLYQDHGMVAALDDKGQRLVFVFGPEYTRQVLSDARLFQSRFFAIRGPRNSPQRHLTCGLLSMNGEEHKRHRRMVMGPLQKKSHTAYHPLLVTLADEMVREWRPGQVRDIFRDMTRHMLRVTSSVLFGLDLPELAYEIGHLTERWVAMNHEVGMGAFVADGKITSAYSRLLDVAGALEEKIRALIEHRRSSTAPGQDLLSLLIRAHDETGAGMTDAELIGQAALLFGAAHLTTANTLTWTLFLLAQHPSIASALAAELAEVLDGSAPSLEQMDRLPLLDRVIKESMRILPASAYSQRVTAEPTDLGPLHLAKGTPVIFSQIITHHMPEIFSGPRQFRPDRWQTITPSPFAYFPFAAGPRMCVGAGLALVILKITLSVILQRYHLSVVPGASIDGKVHFTMFNPTSGMPMLILPPTAPFTCAPVAGNIHELVALESMPRRVSAPLRAA
jgi:cytochrome P450